MVQVFCETLWPLQEIVIFGRCLSFARRIARVDAPGIGVSCDDTAKTHKCAFGQIDVGIHAGFSRQITVIRYHAAAADTDHARDENMVRNMRMMTNVTGTPNCYVIAYGHEWLDVRVFQDKTVLSDLIVTQNGLRADVRNQIILFFFACR